MRLIRNGVDVRLGRAPWFVAHYSVRRYVGERADDSRATITYDGFSCATSACWHSLIELFEAVSIRRITLA